MKLTLELDKHAPNYMVIEETKIDDINHINE